MSQHMSAKEYREQVTSKAEQAENPYSKDLDKQLFGSKDMQKMIKDEAGEMIYIPDTFTKKERKHEEDDLTMQVTDYLETLKLQKKVLVFSHIPQETFTKSWVTKKKNKAMGVRSGVPDMVIVFTRYVLFLELKKEKGGILSDAQLDWNVALHHIEDSREDSPVRYALSRGWAEAKKAIDQFI